MNYGFTREELETSFDNLVRRQVLGADCVKDALPLFISRGLFAPDFKTSIEPKSVVEKVGPRVYALEGAHEPWRPEAIDYLREFR